MTIKRLFFHFFAALLFSVLCFLLYAIADEGNGGIVAEKFHNALDALPFVDNNDFPSTFFLGFVIYPALFYTIVVIICKQVYRFITIRKNA
jgi:hypothetical protein